ncbi:putative exonuclease II [Bacillus phage Bcp1]|uniref:Putative exonuclease II n=1 Tax=Bacillus phage Bcp1 TaxID=584892 RepID=X2JL78_9CAUD|nr:putative exonuclease II [Bacillus phage Bcp1]AHN66585.1 putative exonuclease II [Bacillus phage Bcp1]
MAKKFVVFGDYHLHNFADYAKPVTATLYGQELEVTRSSSSAC